MRSDLRGLIASWALDLFGDELFSLGVVMPLLVVRLGGNETSVGNLLGVLAFVGPMQLLSTWFLERSSERIRPLVFAKAFSLAARIGLLALLCAESHLSAPSVLCGVALLFVFLGILGVLTNPIRLDLERMNVPEIDRVRYFSLRGVAGDAFCLLAGGFSFGAFTWLPYPSCFIALALLAIIAQIASLIALSRLRRSPVQQLDKRMESPWLFLKGSLQLLKPGHGGFEEARFRKFVLVRQLVMLSRCAFPFLAIYAVSRFSAGDHEIGALAIAVTSGRVLGGLAMSALRNRLTDPRKIMQLALAFAAIGLLSALLADSWIHILIASSLHGVFLAGMFVACPMLMMAFAPPGQASRGMTLSMVACHPLGIIMPVVSGYIMARAGFGWLALIGVTFAFAAMVGLSRLRLDVENESRPAFAVAP